MRNPLRQDLGMVSTTGHLSFFYKRDEKGMFIGMVGAYVDDTISAGTTEFEGQAEETESRFEAKDRTYDSFTFAGIRVEKTGSEFLLHQQRYMRA